MLERFIQHVKTEAPSEDETPAMTRDRLKAALPPGAARRMTLLGLMVGVTLPASGPDEGDAVIYSSTYGESPTMETFLDSFPTPSPTLFQTSIHPSAVQQSLIGRGRAVRECWPLTGAAQLPVQAALAALLTPGERVLWCGGDERGSWLRENGAASERSFAFSLELTRSQTPTTLGRISLRPAAESGTLDLPRWFDLLHRRESWSGAAGVGWIMELAWS